MAATAFSHVLIVLIIIARFQRNAYYIMDLKMNGEFRRI